MEVFYEDKNSKLNIEWTGIGLGNFDGLHIGHMTLINTLINQSQIDGLKSIVYTFSSHPENIINKKLVTPMITDLNKKIQLLSQSNLDYLYFEKFDEVSKMSPETFVKEVLVKKFNIRLVVVGFDYRFGFKGEGNTQLLIELGEIYGFKVIVITPVYLEDQIVSSTLIRKNIIDGDMGKVSRLLGREYSISGKVEEGKKIGRTIGFPTANIYPGDTIIVPKNGVYVTRSIVKGKLYNSMTNVGYNPTFVGQSFVSIETYIIDFNDDIYGENIEVFFVRRLREEKRFGNVNELINQIQKDVKEVLI